VVTESVNAGTDLVNASINYTLGDNLENLTLTGTAISGTGNALNNVITGNASNNTLNGAGGLDTLIGGLGNDTYVIDNAGVTVTEQAAEGTDTVNASVDYVLTANVENLTLTGTGNINGAGNTLNNVITGNIGNNTLNGAGGNDTLIGGLGNDTYVIDNAGVTVTEKAAEGTDTVNASVDYVLTANVENLTLTGTGNINGAGNTLNNVITGNIGNNTLNGAGGLDTLIGGLGDDTYVIDNAGVTVTEKAAEGTDTVNASINYILGDNLENLTLTGTAISGTGNGLDNTITGNASDNTIDGGVGADTMIGGVGNDTYNVDNTLDVITELDTPGSGIDTVNTNATYTLGANVENLTLTGTGNINGTGNNLNNVITGNDGNNTLNGAGGLDTLIGGLGNDTYVIDNAGVTVTEKAAEGTDTVNASITYTLGDNLENLTLTGIGNINGTGNALNNVIAGNSGNNTLNGAGGLDTLIGGLGDDTYVINNAGVVVTESVNAGTDLVNASINYTLGDNLENLTLTGTGDIDGTGNELANIITGNAGNNTLNGGVGADTMIGGAGNDTYTVDNTLDAIAELAIPGSGIDTVNANATYTLGANVENLNLTGTGNINGTGNELANLINGNSGNNIIDGGAGADTMVGGAGNDIYIVDNTGDAVSEEVNAGIDKIEASITYSLGANIENLTLTSTASIDGTGNELVNVITGNDGNNVLDGGLEGDTMSGGLGDDTYIVDNAGDVVTEAANAGTDIVKSSVNFTLGANFENLTLTGIGSTTGFGNELNNIIIGNTNNNTIGGGAGNDTLTGGTGADKFVFGGTPLPTATSVTTLMGVDTITDFTSGIDKLVLSQITFSAIKVNSTGGITNFVVVANDNLVDSQEAAIIYSQSTGNLFYKPTGCLPGLGVSGGKFATLAGSPTLSANSIQISDTFPNINTAGGFGNQTYNVGAGNNTFAGGIGNDTYIIDADVATGTNTINEQPTEGIYDGGFDTLDFSSSSTGITINLSSNTVQTVATGVELVLPLLNLESVIGGSGDDVITGNSGTNGFTGGGGDDKFIFSTGTNTIAPVSTLFGLDVFEDFSSGDKLVFDKKNFSALTVDQDGIVNFASVLNDGLVDTNAAAIVYSQSSKKLFYNDNGTAAGLGSNGGAIGMFCAPYQLSVLDIQEKSYDYTTILIG
jgi:trimeric autotransporter adhesin